MLSLSLFILAAQAAQTPMYEAELIFPRNPKHNHGSSIVETADGDLIASWFHGTGEPSAKMTTCCSRARANERVPRTGRSRS
ncbi:MAG: hypothetical protein NTU83_00720 [Candidatus Hydrogenedentes bacterium]|nr:hypothetical protein [Candidatus Hydrogenedentota bacterium]